MREVKKLLESQTPSASKILTSHSCTMEFRLPKSERTCNWGKPNMCNLFEDIVHGVLQSFLYISVDVERWEAL